MPFPLLKIFTTIDFLYIYIYRGYYNCLNSAGEIYDKTKYGWLQGRQVRTNSQFFIVSISQIKVWMLSKLYNQLPEYRRTDVLDAAVKGTPCYYSNCSYYY